MTGKKVLSVDVIDKWLKDLDWHVRAAAMKACEGRSDITPDVIEIGLKDPDCDVRAAAMKACEGRSDITQDVIDKWLKDPDWHVRAAAMKACEGRSDITPDVIDKWLKDPDWHVRAAAMKACEISGIQIPVIRTIEPPNQVYKKCVCGVIVVAEIPKDAQVRGTVEGKCRASKAVIKEIIGDVCGEPVGISKHDLKTLYYKGDEVIIQDFDYSNEECSAGFHFFCTRKQAENY